MRTLITLTLLIACFGCRESLTPSDQNDRVETAAECGQQSGASKMILATVEPGNFPYQPKIIDFDLDSGVFTVLSAGESSDVMLAKVTPCEGYLFNRTAESHNFRSIVKTDSVISVGSQIALQSEKSSDPASIALLSRDYLLLGNYASGSLSVINRFTGESLLQKDSGFGLSASTPLRAAGLVVKTEDDRTSVFVTHDSLEFQGNKALVGSSQAVIALDWSGSDLLPSSQVPNVTPLTGSFPHFLAELEGGELVYTSFCAKFMRNPDLGGPCRSVVEKFSPATGDAAVIWNLDDLPYHGNGTAIADPKQAGSFYASVQRVSDGAMVFAHFNSVSKSVREIRAYEAGSYGAWYASFDPSGRYLLIGDGSGDRGSLVVFDPELDAIIADYPLNGAPLSGIWLE